MTSVEGILAASRRLKKVHVERTLEDGSSVVETRGEDGAFVTVQSIEDASSSSAVDDVSVSNRRRKAVQRKQKMGFVVDLKPDMQCANITRGLYMGSQDVAASSQLLTANRITHVVNCATGVKNFFPRQFSYLSIALLDTDAQELRPMIDQAHDFMRSAIEEGGRVFVHCNAGISRASSLVISYLIRFEHLTFQAALEKTRLSRPVAKPNPSFARQLQVYSDECQQFAPSSHS